MTHLKWIEQIRVRSTAQRLREEMPGITKRVRDIKTAEDGPDAFCMQHALYGSDLVIFLVWENNARPGKTLEGRLMAEQMSELGIADHTVWIPATINNTQRRNTMAKTVLITGCSTGFGKLTAKKFHEQGWQVIATMRTPEKETELTQLDGVLVTRLDVTDPLSIEAAVNLGLETFGGIDVLVNNAGYGGHSLFEQMSDDAIRAMYDTNVFGVMNVARAVLPVMREKGEGCVINVTSMAGMMGAPTISVYASTKFAVQGLTEGMALEYKPLNIRVKSVLPGAYPTTGFNANTEDQLDGGGDQLAGHGRKLYNHIQTVAEQMAGQGGGVADPREVSDKIWECATADTPVHNPVGADAQMLAGMMSPQPRQDFLDQMENLLLP